MLTVIKNQRYEFRHSLFSKLVKKKVVAVECLLMKKRSFDGRDINQQTQPEDTTSGMKQPIGQFPLKKC